MLNRLLKEGVNRQLRSGCLVMDRVPFQPDIMQHVYDNHKQNWAPTGSKDTKMDYPPQVVMIEDQS